MPFVLGQTKRKIIATTTKELRDRESERYLVNGQRKIYIRTYVIFARSHNTTYGLELIKSKIAMQVLCMLAPYKKKDNETLIETHNAFIKE